MLNLIIGFILCAILYTFFPALAVYPSKWVRAAWAWIKGGGFQRSWARLKAWLDFKAQS